MYLAVQIRFYVQVNVKWNLWNNNNKNIANHNT